MDSPPFHWRGVSGGRLAQRLAQRLYTPLVAGSNPASPTIFQLENGDSGSTEPKLKRSQRASVRNSRIPHIGKKRLRGDREVMQDPLKVTYQNLSASIKYYPSDGLFHAYWNIGGIKGKAASKNLEGAEAKAKEAMRKLHRLRVSMM